MLPYLPSVCTSTNTMLIYTIGGAGYLDLAAPRTAETMIESATNFIRGCESELRTSLDQTKSCGKPQSRIGAWTGLTSPGWDIEGTAMRTMAHNDTGRRHRPTSPSNVAWTKTCSGASSSASFSHPAHHACIRSPCPKAVEVCVFGPGPRPGSQPNFFWATNYGDRNRLFSPSLFQDLDGQRQQGRI